MSLPPEIIEEFKDLEPTKKLYYEDAYIKEFDSQVIKKVNFQDKVYIALRETAFFAESGGQGGDVGFIRGPEGSLRVIDTQAIDEEVVIHICEPIEGQVNEGDNIHGEINWEIRYNRMRHHTGSHVVFAAIREALRVKKLIYKGVHVGETWARIDINYDDPITDEQIREIELLANRICFENRPVKIFYMNREEAERVYGDKLGVTEVTPTGIVRVVEIEGWDVALCSGTHVRSTAEIGIIKILERYKLEKGVQRIRLAVGPSAYDKIDEIILRANRAARLLNASLDDLDEKIENLIRKKEELEDKLKSLRKRLAKYEAYYLLQQAKTIGELKLVVQEIPDADISMLRNIVMEITKFDPSSIVVLGSIMDRAYVVAAAGNKAIEYGIKINDYVVYLKNILGGKGGGSPKIIQFAGESLSKLKEALKVLEDKIKENIKA